MLFRSRADEPEHPATSSQTSPSTRSSTPLAFPSTTSSSRCCDHQLNPPCARDLGFSRALRISLWPTWENSYGSAHFGSRHCSESDHRASKADDLLHLSERFGHLPGAGIGHSVLCFLLESEQRGQSIASCDAHVGNITQEQYGVSVVVASGMHPEANTADRICCRDTGENGVGDRCRTLRSRIGSGTGESCEISEAPRLFEARCSVRRGAVLRASSPTRHVWPEDLCRRHRWRPQD